MKAQGLLGIGILVSMCCASAQAWYQPGWDRPVFRANLSVLDQEGQAPQVLDNAKTVQLVMTQQDGASSPTGFVLLIDGQFKQAYDVKSSAKDACNDITYKLVPIQQQGNYRLDAADQSIQVVDHVGRTCMDFRRFRWEMDMKNINLLHGMEGRVRLVGNPQSVITPQ